MIADRLRIEQAVTNLVDNALRHGAGPVVVRARRVGDEVELSVEDGGAGVPPEDAEGVFERFVRGGSAAAGQGAGLGLSIVRAIARAHGGEARIEATATASVRLLGLRSPALGSRPALAILLRWSPRSSATGRSATSGWPASPRTPGSWLQIVASGWLILQLTGSPAAVGALALVTRAPAIGLSTVAGQLADRFDRRAVGIWTFLLQAAAAGALALITGLTGPEVWSIYALTFLVGVGFALGLPAMLALIPTLVPAPAPLAGGEPERGRHQRRAPGRAGDRRGDPGALRRDRLLRGQRRLLPGPGASCCCGCRPAAPCPPPGGRRHGARRWRYAAARRRACAGCWSGMAVFTALASPIQELAPVVADRLDAGPGGARAAARRDGRRRAASAPGCSSACTAAACRATARCPSPP